jgi:hypothetical protein
MPRFHTGLHTSDWHSYPPPPYKAKGWSITFKELTTEYQRGGEYSGDKFYPYKEVIISARDQVTAQRAANTIYNVRNLLQGSNLFGMPQWSGQNRPYVVTSKPANGSGPGLGSFALLSNSDTMLFNYE